MNWKKTFFKPRWQHKDPEIRAHAVASGQEPELLQAMEHIVASDESLEVRAAAARRVNRALVVAQALGSESEAAVVDALRSRLQNLLTNPSAHDSTPVRVEALGLAGDRALLEAVAMAGPEPDLRRAALKKIERQGLLGDRAIEDPEPDLRRLAASRIRQPSTLKRVIDATRTTDKQLHQELVQRLHREQLAAGDTEAISREALDICERLESQLLGATDPDEAVLGELEKQWSAVQAKAPETLRARFEADLLRAREPRKVAPAAQPAPKPEPDPEPVAAPAPDASEAPAEEVAAAPDEHQATPVPRLLEVHQALEKLEERQRVAEPAKVDRLAGQWDKAFATLEQPTAADQALAETVHALIQRLRERAQAAEVATKAALQQASGLLSDMQKALEDGELHKALELRAKLQDAGKPLTGRREWKAIQSSLSSTLGRLRELRDWQHWANDKIRRRLIGELEGLPASGMHPDAVLERIKALQGEWKALEASEQIPGDRHYAAAPWMWRKFNAAGQQAFQMTKPFLDKRSEVQAKQMEALQATANALLELAQAENVDLNALNQGMSDARDALRSLSTLSARDRKKTAALLKKALDAGKNQKQAHYDAIEKEKMKLIREAGQLQHMEDRGEALLQAKSLQRQWQAAGSLWRSRENELWKQFREPIDPLFAALDEARESERAEIAERVARQAALCEQMEQVLASEDDALADARGRVQGLNDEWDSFRNADRKLKARFESALATFEQRESAWRRSEAARERARWWLKADLLHTWETGALPAAKRKSLETQWVKAGAGATELDQALDKRFSADPGSASTAEETDDLVEQAQRIAISLEFLAGLPGPDNEKDLRMQFQVERLSASMSGERERIPAAREARQLERDWLLMDPLPEKAFTEFRQRIRAAVVHILGE